ncbi:MAG: hypothetical protein AAGD11_16100, partial [Planctomycetota bacterium]
GDGSDGQTGGTGGTGGAGAGGAGGTIKLVGSVLQTNDNADGTTNDNTSITVGGGADGRSGDGNNASGADGRVIYGGNTGLEFNGGELSVVGGAPSSGSVEGDASTTLTTFTTDNPFLFDSNPTDDLVYSNSVAQFFFDGAQEAVYTFQIRPRNLQDPITFNVEFAAGDSVNAFQAAVAAEIDAIDGFVAEILSDTVVVTAQNVNDFFVNVLIGDANVTDDFVFTRMTSITVLQPNAQRYQVSVGTTSGNQLGSAQVEVGEGGSIDFLANSLREQIDAIPEVIATRAGDRVLVRTVQRGGVAVLNPIESNIDSPYIAGLLGGADTFGYFDTITSAELVASQANTPTSALVGVYRFDMGANSFINSFDTTDYTGYDLLLITNLTDQSLASPSLGVHLETSIDASADELLAYRGLHETNRQELSSLPVGTVWGTLIPEDATTVSVSIAGAVTNIDSATLTDENALFITTSRPTLATFGPEGVVEDFGGLREVVESPDGTLLYALATDRDALLVINAADNTIRQVIEDEIDGQAGARGMRDLTLSTNADLLFAVSADADVAVFQVDPATGTLSLSQVQEDVVNGEIEQFVLNDIVQGANAETAAIHFRQFQDSDLARDVVRVFELDVTTGDLTRVSDNAPSVIDQRLYDDGEVRGLGLLGTDLYILTSTGLEARGINNPNFFLIARDTISGAANGIDNPSSLSLGPERAYIVSEANNSVTIIDIQDEFMLPFELNFAQTVANGVGGVTGMLAPVSVAESGGGDLFYVAGRDGDSLSVFEFDPVDGDANFTQRLVNNTGGVEGLTTPTSMIVTTGGSVYVATQTEGASRGGYVRFDPLTGIGNAIVNRDEFDRDDTLIILDDPFADTPGVITTWTYSGSNAGPDFANFVTPVLLSRSGDNWTVTGVGTRRLVLSNSQTSDFGLVSGSDETAGRYFGWISDPDSMAAGGVVYTDDTDDSAFLFNFVGAPTLSVGETLSGLTGVSRTYSAAAAASITASADSVAAEFTGVETLTVATGSGEDTITLDDAPGVEVASTSISVGAGADSVILEDLSATTDVSLGAGDDLAELRTETSATVRIDGNEDSDTINLALVGDNAVTTINGDDGLGGTDGADTFFVAGGRLASTTTTTINGGLPTGGSTGDTLIFDPGDADFNPLTDLDPAPVDNQANGSVGLVGKGTVNYTSIEPQAVVLSAPIITVTSFDATIDEGDAFNATVSVNYLGNTQVGDVVWDFEGSGDFDSATGESINLTWAQLRGLGINDGDEVYENRIAVRASSEVDGVTVTTTEFITITVEDIPPVVNVSTDLPINRGVVGQEYTINFGSSDQGDDSDIGWIVDWGDGSPTQTFGAGTRSATHVFDEVDNYTVTVSVIDEDSNPAVAASDSLTAIILAGEDAVDAGGVYLIDEGEGVTLQAAALGTPSGFAWDLDDDGEFDDATGATVPLTWAELQTFGINDDGFFSVRVEVTYDPTLGTQETDVDSATIVVSNVAPTATFTNSGPVDEGSELGDVTLDFSAQIEPSDADTGSGLLYSYDFGDNGTFEFTNVAGLSSVDVPAALIADGESQLVVRGVIADKDGGRTEYTTVVSIVNVDPTIELTPSTTTPVEGADFELTIGLTDPGADTLVSATVDWGDGTVDTVSDISAPLTHAFADDGATTITVTIADEDGTYVETLDVTVSNAAPTLTDLAIADSLGGPDLVEGTPVSLSGVITDAGAGDTFTLTVDWGDGNTEDFDFDAGTTVFDVTHVYEDDGDYDVEATLTDGVDTTAPQELPITVLNAAPEVAFGLDRLTLVEGDTVALTGSVVDLGVGDAHTVDIVWGDGEVANDVAVVDGLFTATHTYVDDNPTATQSDDYQISVTATDTVDAASTSTVGPTTVNVNNSDPQLASVTAGDSITPGETFTLSTTFTDLGLNDEFTLEVDWGDGDVTTDATIVFDNIAGTGTITAAHVYDTEQIYPILVTLTDDDGGSSVTELTSAVVGTNLAPVVADQSFSVAEGSPFDAIVGNVAANDPNIGDILSYAIDDDSIFVVDSATGEITVRDQTQLDLDLNPVGFTFIVTVTDLNGLEDSATITVTLDNTNEAPQIDDQIFSVAEAAPAGTVVGTVIADDPDAGDSLTYSLNDTSLFDIDGNTGQISVVDISPFALPGITGFTLLVTATDIGGLSDTSTLVVNLEADDGSSADFDLDGDTDGFDFLLWQRGLGIAAPNGVKGDGDADDDQDVDGIDLAIWETQYGQSTPGDNTAPTVETSTIQNGLVQRSFVDTLQFDFSEQVNLSELISNGTIASAISLTNLGVDVANDVNQIVLLTAAQFQYEFDASVGLSRLTWSLDEFSGTASSLEDGLYRLTIDASFVSDAAGNALDGNGNGTAGDNFVLEFHRLSGDTNGDTMVGTTDMTLVDSALGSVSTDPLWDPNVDLDRDQRVNVRDRLIVARAAGNQIIPESAPVSAPLIVQGDFSGTGTVGSEDLSVWQANFGINSASPFEGDADFDGDVDGADFLAWQRSMPANLALSAISVQPSSQIEARLASFAEVDAAIESQEATASTSSLDFGDLAAAATALANTDTAVAVTRDAALDQVHVGGPSLAPWQFDELQAGQPNNPSEPRFNSQTATDEQERVEAFESFFNDEGLSADPSDWRF